MCVNESEIAWLSGIFEGEGSIYISKNKYVQLKVAMSDLDTVEKIKRIADCGTIKTYANNRYTNAKPMYQWVISEKDNVLRLLELMSPWLSERRLGKAFQAIDALKNNNGIGFNQYALRKERRESQPI